VRHGLPPILNKFNLNPMPSCSKASRGLFVQPWVTSIFTRLAISPRSSLRQFPGCYAIRAGRNLHDKEFRYLRTVIVTAGVHQRFGSELRLALRTSNLQLYNSQLYNFLSFVVCCLLFVVSCLVTCAKHRFHPSP